MRGPAGRGDDDLVAGIQQRTHYMPQDRLGAAVDDDLGNTPGIGGDDRPPGRHSFEKRQREGLGFRGQDRQVGGGEQSWNVFDDSQETDVAVDGK